MIEQQSHFFEVEVLFANSNAELLVAQAKKFQPNCIVIADESKFDFVKSSLQNHDIKVYGGAETICQVLQMETIDIVLTAMVGFAGLKPTIAAIQSGKTIALANKETLVVAGELVTKLARENGVNIYPVDSEHSAIFQCMVGEWQNPIEKIYLTASGGPFREKSFDELKHVTKEQALKHPNWNMGAKVTIDSATLMNKGLEVIEARWLFNLKSEQVEVIIHPQSIIHSIVQFEDGSMKAQMSLPDMRMPIQFALSYPLRLKSDFPRFQFPGHSQLTFERPDTKTFRNLALAYIALNKGGNLPCVINAANEIVVDAFLKDNISFTGMTEIIERCMEKIPFIEKPDYNDYVFTDDETRKFAFSLLKS